MDASGTTLDKEPVSGVVLEQIKLQNNPYISVRIGVPADAANIGGLNLFGEKFGDFAQTLTLRLGYHLTSVSFRQKICWFLFRANRFHGIFQNY